MNLEMKYLKQLILVLIYSIVPYFAAVTYSQTVIPPKLTFDDLKNYSSENDIFRIESFIFKIYKCGKCPPKAWCKPCENNLIVVDNLQDQGGALPDSLKIFTGQIETNKFLLKKKYLFTVKPRGNRTEGSPITDVELISFVKLKT
jgi:hypothetical protein